MKKRGEKKRRRHEAPVLGVEEFAHRKGVTKAIHGFRKRKEKKRVETAKALRRYEKVMKQEGFEAGKGASRKRQTKDESAVLEHKEEEEEDHNTQTKPSSNTHKRRKKMNPFQKTLQKADKKKKEVQKAQEEHKAREKKRLEKLRQRRCRTKLLTQRTRKGQPIMKNVVEDILNKLQKEGPK